MFTRRYRLDKSVIKESLTTKSLAKFYFKPESDVFYYKLTSHLNTEYGLSIQCGWGLEVNVELEERIFNRLTENSLEKLEKVIHFISLDDNKMMPIVVAQIHQYDEYRVIEVKFQNMMLFEAFVPPIWFGEEINDTHYDFNLAFKNNITAPQERKQII